jgi:hypothetical protein
MPPIGEVFIDIAIAIRKRSAEQRRTGKEDHWHTTDRPAVTPVNRAPRSGRPPAAGEAAGDNRKAGGKEAALRRRCPVCMLVSSRV